MLKDIFQIYKTGKQLGLTTKEINKILLFNNTRHPLLYTILLIILIVGLGIFAVMMGIVAVRNTYPAGTLYSTVKKKDFKRKK